MSELYPEVRAELVYDEHDADQGVCIFGITRHSTKDDRYPSDLQFFVDRWYSGYYYAGVFFHQYDRVCVECYALEHWGPYYEWSNFLTMLKNRKW